jgi:hypothetical protein
MGITMRSHVLACLLLLVPVGAGAGQTSQSEKATPPTPTLDVAMELLASRPLVRATINGQGPFALLIDPQAVKTLLDPRLAEALNLKPQPGGGAGTPQYQIDLGFGTTSVAKVPVEIVDLTRFAPEVVAAARPRGVISLSIWQDQLVTLDFARWRVQVVPGALPEPNGKDIVALSAGQVRVMLVIGEYSGPCEVDPNFPGGLLLPSATATDLTLAEKPRAVPSVNTRTGPVPVEEARLTMPGVIGGFAFDAPLVQFGGANDRALLGTAWLSSFTLTYDMSHGRVRLDRQRLP